MKTTDLMVGDWVSYCGFYNKAIYIGQKVSMYNGKGTEFTTDPEYIRPIPLTEKILVKNGFERCDYNNQYFIIDDVINLITPKWRGGTEYYACAWYQDEFNDLVQHIEICKCAYVHQLQHLLRLVGVQKEIEL